MKGPCSFCRIRPVTTSTPQRIFEHPSEVVLKDGSRTNHGGVPVSRRGRAASLNTAGRWAATSFALFPYRDSVKLFGFQKAILPQILKQSDPSNKVCDIRPHSADSETFTPPRISRDGDAHLRTACPHHSSSNIADKFHRRTIDRNGFPLPNCRLFDCSIMASNGLD